MYFDAPKPKNTKLVPILVGYYSATDGRLASVLNIEAITGETPDILSAYILDALHANWFSLNPDL